MTTRTISTKLAVEGEAEYKQAIAACNSELTTLKSDLALVESEFRSNANSMETLSARGTKEAHRGAGQKGSSDFWNKSKDAITQLAAAGVAKAVEKIFAALKECVDMFASFESQMSTVQAISGAAGEPMAALAEKAKYMAR